MTAARTQESPYRWVIVATSSIILAIGIGLIINGFSVFIIPLGDAFGWQRGEVSLINFAGLAGTAPGGVIMGRVADRLSVRWISLFGVIVLGLCLLAAAHADALWQFYLLFFVGGFFGAGSLFAPLIANVGNWFHSHVGLALGITSAGQALGQGGVPFAGALLIGAFGWSDALTAMGAVTLLGLVPLALLTRPAPPEIAASTEPTAAHASAPPVLSPTTAVIWMSAAVIFCCTCMSVPLMHLVPLVQDRGFTLDEGASVLLVMLIAGIVGRIAFGKLADMIGPIRAYWMASCWQTVLVFAFVRLDSLDSFYLFAIVYGFGYAGVMTGILVCMRVLTPVSRRASALGIVTMFAWIGHGIGGYQAGLFFDLTGSYTLSYANAALAGVINLFVVGSLYLTVAHRRAAAVAAG